MKATTRSVSPVIAARLLLGLLVLSTLLALPLPISGAQTPPGPEITFRGVSTAVRFDVSPPLRDIPPAQLDPNMVFEDPDLDWGIEVPAGSQDVDPVVQTTVGPHMIPAPLITFDGFDNQLTYTPPDPVGDVGPNHYVAMSNVHFAVYDKSGNLLYGPYPNNTLWSGFGGACESQNSGDPIVVYDQLADRWMLTQFTSSPAPDYYNCVALSVDGDPTGSYYRWAFSTGSNFPDYPKYGVWPDAYYISTREFGSPNGIGAYALDRAAMLAGDPSPDVVSFLVNPDYNAGHGLLPADIDGTTLPPPGSPEYFMGTMDDGGPLGAPQDAMTLWKFTVNWADPGSSTFVLADTLPTAPFDSIFPCSPGSRDCIPQPGTSEKIDILSYRQRPLWRLAYRNFGTHESLVTNQAVEATTNMAGIRWYEVRDPNGTPTIYQQGTYAPGSTDGIHRWMGSIAMDQQGNMALGYSASNGSDTYPSVWYTGRLASDPLGQMSQGEGSFVDGSGSQLSTGSRWGDYTSMNVDPVDDCTFWYINEYYPTTSSTEWYLRIGAFKFPSCGVTSGADLSVTKVDDPDPVLPGGTLTYTLDINNAGPSAITPTIASNPAIISIPSSGAASPYPSIINVSGFTETVAKATVTLHNVNHTWPDDIDIILVGPGGQHTYLMSDAGFNYDLVDVTLTFDDAAGPVPDGSQIVAGTYQPTDYAPTDTFPAPAPPGPYGTSLSLFEGIDPNGTWSLYVVDDSGGDAGYIADGWSLALYTGDVVTMTDDLPAGVTLGTVSAPGWICNQAGQQLTCTTSDLPVGTTQIELVNTAPGSTGYITNNVEIASTLTDTNPGNNAGYATTLVDTAPVAADDSYTATEDTDLVVSAPGVLDNDSDSDSDPLVAQLRDSPTHGTVILNPDGSFTYSPDADYFGADAFSYVLSDGYLTDTATVDLDVFPVNDPPVAQDDSYNTPEDEALVVAAPGVLDNDDDVDGDTLTAVVLTDPQSGTLALAVDGSFVYTPTAEYNGADAFTYIASDGALTDTATVNLTIDPVNDGPLAVDDAYTTTEDTDLVVTAPGVLGNDTDIDDDPLSATVLDAPLYGTLALSADGSFTYTPNLNYSGADSFTYIASDGALTDTAMVYMIITPVNDAPIVDAGPDQVGDEGADLAFTGAYTDPEGQTVDVEWDLGDGSTMTGTLTPTHAYGDEGIYTVTLTVTDDEGAVGVDTLVVTVANVVPELAPLPDLNVDVGQAVTLTGSFTDPGWLDAHQVVLSWGDGMTETHDLAAGVYDFSTTYTYTAAGVYTATVTASDYDGGQDSESFTVTVVMDQYMIYLPVLYK